LSLSLKGYLFMNDAYFKEHAARVRNIASLADPFTKKRLLALAEKYDPAKPTRATPLPSVAITSKHPDRSGNDAG
jgi:arginine utilization protein RocB